MGGGRDRNGRETLREGKRFPCSAVIESSLERNVYVKPGQEEVDLPRVPALLAAIPRESPIVFEPAHWMPFLFLGAGIYLMLAIGLLRRRQGPGTRILGLCMLSVAAWTVAAVAELAAESTEAALLAAKFKYTGIALVGPLILLFFVRYLEYDERLALRPVHVAALFAIPIATILITWTNDGHFWMWADSQRHGARTWEMREHWGPWFWRVHLPYSYLAMSVNLLLLALEWFRGTKLQRPQVAVLTAATLLPLVVNVLFILGQIPGHFGPTPIALAASSVLYAWGFVRLELFRQSPIAYHAVLEHMQDAVLVVDAHDRVVDLNPAAIRLCRREKSADVLGHRLDEVLPLGWSSGEASKETGRIAADSEDEDGRRLETTISPIRVASGSLRGRVILLRDVSERHRAERALQRSEALVRSLVEVSPNGILRLQPKTDSTGVIRDFVCLFANATAARWIDRSQEELIGQPFKHFAHPHTSHLFQAFRDVLQTGEGCDIERAVNHHGKEVWLRFLAVPADADLLVTCVDVTETKLREREMAAAASEDPLTGLLNRRGFEADAESLLLDASDRMERGALLYLDLDGFKKINDSLGHEVGDLLLCEIAARLQLCTRGPDLLSRIGGDEFVLLLIDVDEEGGRDVADRIACATRRPIRIDSGEVACPTSIGLALYPEDGADLKSLLQSADRAMYRAKAAGGDGVVLARESLSASPSTATDPDR